jgi:hypothetical protein
VIAASDRDSRALRLLERVGEVAGAWAFWWFSKAWRLRLRGRIVEHSTMGWAASVEWLAVVHGEPYHAEEPAQDAAEAGYEVRSSAEEDAEAGGGEAEGAGETDAEEVARRSKQAGFDRSRGRERASDRRTFRPGVYSAHDNP